MTRTVLVARMLMVAVACQGLGSVARAQDQSFGKDIPLKAAATSIVPPGFKVDYGEGVDGNASVSWPKSENWKKAVSAAAASGGYAATVDGQTVRISKPGAAKAGTKPVTKTASTEADRPVKDGEGDDGGAERRRLREEKRQGMERRFHEAHARPGRRVREAEREAGPRHRRRHEREEDVGESTGPVVSDAGFVIVPEHAERTVRHRSSEVDAPPAEEGSHARGGFVATQGTSLYATLEEWAARDGWRVEYKSQFQYSLKASARFQGGFQEAATEIIRSMANVRPQPTAEFFKGNKVLVIDSTGLDEAAAQ